MSKRQKIRKAIIITMFFTFPVTIAWMSPAMPIIFALLGGIIVGSVILFLLLFVFSLFLGRAFCGFICPGSGLSECLQLINEKKLKNTKYRAIKYFAWVLLLIATIASFIRVGGIYEVDFFAGLEGGWIFLIAPYRYAIYFGVLALALVFAILLGRRSFCQCACWIAPFMIIGTKLSEWLKLPRLRLSGNKDTCISCKQCSEKCPMTLDVMSMVRDQNMKHAECILCGECVDICPEKSIAYAFKDKSS